MKSLWSTSILLALVPPTIAVIRESIANQLPLGICRKAPHSLELQVCLQAGRNGGGALAEAAIKPELSPSTPITSNSVWSLTSPCYDTSLNGTNSTFCVYTSSSFADNHGITIVTSPKRASDIAQSDAFVHPESVRGFNRDFVSEAEHGRASNLPPLRYRVEAMAGKGYGVVATQFLNRGDLIMSTTASVLVDYQVFEALPEALARKLQAAGVDSLPDLHRTRLLNLSTHDGPKESYEATVAKILSTNAFDIDADTDDEEYGYFAVFPEISRLNHDCRPNADYHFDHATLTQHIYAVRPIAAGEEITVSYMDLIKTRKQRMEKLKSTWGFDCSCSLCSQSRALSKASDARIAQISELRSEFQDFTTASRATPQMAELLISLYEQERMDAMIYEAYSYAAMEWNGVGEPWLAVKYARLAVEYGLMSVGTRDVDVSEMRQLAADPWAHWSWLLRKSRRLQWGKKEKKGGKSQQEEHGSQGTEAR